MFMRFRGAGVGHKSTHKVTQCLLLDRDKLDSRPLTLECEHESSMEDVEEDEQNSQPTDDSSDSTSESEDNDDDDEDNMDIDGVEVEDHPQVMDDELDDEMDEYGYGGLEQVEDEMEEDAGTAEDEDGLGSANTEPDYANL